MKLEKTEILKNGRASVLVDGQFGSTGKGVFAAFIGTHNEMDIAVSNAGPNSGHTAIFDGKPKVAYHLPMSGAMPPKIEDDRPTVYLSAGAIIDPLLLVDEMGTFGLKASNVVVHPSAAVIHSRHKVRENDRESSIAAVASTQKGVGEALADKIRRIPSSSFSEFYFSSGSGYKEIYGDRIRPEDIHAVEFTSCFQSNASVLVEVSQGFSLSLNASGFYPYTTSRDCTVNQALSDANIHPHFLHRTVMTMRTYPIRVGNIVKDDTMIGYSGNGYKDQKELTWEQVGVAPEYTTVTKRMRRVFSWSHIQTVCAMRANRPTDIFLNFCNYLKSTNDFEDTVTSIRNAAEYVGLEAPKIWYGFGPNHLTDIVETYEEAHALVAKGANK